MKLQQRKLKEQFFIDRSGKMKRFAKTRAWAAGFSYKQGRRWIKTERTYHPFSPRRPHSVNSSIPFPPTIPCYLSTEPSLTHARSNTRKMASPSTRRRWRKEVRACSGRLVQVPGEGGRKRQRGRSRRSAEGMSHTS